MKGIILAGGAGTRLHPLTISYSKQLLPVFDKPMIYYPLCTLMSANIRDILIITTPHDQINFKKLLGNGNQWGINLKYEIQNNPNGIAEAFIIGEKFISNNNVALILGDNIFYGINIEKILTNSTSNFSGAKIFAYQVNDPERYGVIEINNDKIISIEEKPKIPKSPFVVTGLYFYDNSVIDIAKKIKPSHRKELEITDINKVYLKKNKIDVITLKQGMVWLDVGTTTSMLQAAQFVQTIQERQQIQIGCPEEISLKKGWISKEKLKALISQLPNNSYGDYIRKIINYK